mmetsp:Transcript_14994/g.32010  ORF Transcript_14994/g.32010 Transcript_14994/m.32010 type:complete len:204 (+) Transcript_14994:135-746(+)
MNALSRSFMRSADNLGASSDKIAGELSCSWPRPKLQLSVQPLFCPSRLRIICFASATTPLDKSHVRAVASTKMAALSGPNRKAPTQQPRSASLVPGRRRALRRLRSELSGLDIPPFRSFSPDCAGPREISSIAPLTNPSTVATSVSSALCPWLQSGCSPTRRFAVDVPFREAQPSAMASASGPSMPSRRASVPALASTSACAS